MASYSVDKASAAHAKELIEARQYVLESDWGDEQPSADDENAFLEKHSWDEYAAWHLGLKVPPTRPRPATASATATSAASIAPA